MLIPPAYAQTAGAAAQPSAAALVAQFAPIALIVALFWILFLRPQQKRQREQQARIDAVRKGDQVVTAGGVMGRVTRVEDSVVEVEIAANTRVRVVKSTLTEVTSNAKPAND